MRLLTTNVQYGRFHWLCSSGRRRRNVRTFNTTVTAPTITNVRGSSTTTVCNTVSAIDSQKDGRKIDTADDITLDKKSDAAARTSSEIHKGPAILRTSHSIRSRPQPNLLYIPGLRSLPFWTQQQLIENEKLIKNRIAYGDPTITAIVEHLDNHYDTISNEYHAFCNNRHKFDSCGIKTTFTNNVHTNSSDSVLVKAGATRQVPNRQQETNGHATNIKSSNEHDMHLINKGGKWDWDSYMTKGTILTSSSPLTTADHTSSTMSQEAASAPLFQQCFPQTVSILEAFRNDGQPTNSLLRNQLLEHIPFGYVFFSTLHEQTHILPHTSPINFRLRIHVPIYVPEQQQQQQQQQHTDNKDARKPTCGIRVGNVIREWYAGKSLVLDDSYEHEVWNDHHHPAPTTNTVITTNSSHQPLKRRVLLLIDIWHPDVTQDERDEICYMFQTAKDQGWLSS